MVIRPGENAAPVDARTGDDGKLRATRRQATGDARWFFALTGLVIILGGGILALVIVALLQGE